MYIVLLMLGWLVIIGVLCLVCYLFYAYYLYYCSVETSFIKPLFPHSTWRSTLTTFFIAPRIFGGYPLNFRGVPCYFFAATPTKFSRVPQPKNFARCGFAPTSHAPSKSFTNPTTQLSQRMHSRYNGFYTSRLGEYTWLGKIYHRLNFGTNLTCFCDSII